MSHLHLGRASTIDVPVLPPLGPGDFPCPAGGTSCEVPLSLCKFHGNSGGSGGEVGVECPRLFDLSPALKSLLKRNVAAFTAGYRGNSKLGLPEQPKWVESFSEQKQHEGDLTTTCTGKDTRNSYVEASVLSSLENLSLKEERAADCAVEKREEMIMDFIRLIPELEGQVKERKEWAQQKALQAARKLSNDLTELKTLRMEREENLQMKKVRQGMDESKLKHLEEMEDAVRKSCGQVDLANAIVQRLEIENAEITADMKASELSSSELASKCFEMVKREKKYLKRLLASEKQEAKQQKGVAKERKKIVELHQQLKKVEEAQKEAEVKWRQEASAKEQAIAQAEEERRAKEAVDASIKRKHEALRQKIELDFQRYIDDIRRLEEELSHLKASEGSTQVNWKKTIKEVNTKMLHGSQKPQESSQKEANHDRRLCLICKSNEVSVVFLPCAHQVLCVGCNEDHEKKAKACPCCGFQIDQRIRVFGVGA